MYESYLNVGLDDLIDAVQRCFDSAEADRVRIYQSSVRTDGGDAVPGAAMAVLVQQMVDQASAGVAFTANPLTGKVAGHFGCPQDIEWAVDRAGSVYVLQARPMTGNAAQLLRTGQMVTVDGSAGTVELTGTVELPEP
jgi:phosphoenolpyruvate synthase/pyruvate phosphate dikinase